MLPTASALRPNFFLLASLFLFGRRLYEAKIWIQIPIVGSKLDTDPQRGQYYEHCSRSIVPGEAAMSAPPFFQSAGRGDLLYWGEKEGPTVVIWESLSEQGNERGKHNARLGRVVQVKKRGEEIWKSAHVSSAEKKSSLTVMKQNRKRKRTKRMKAKRMHITGRAIQVMVEARQHQNGSERGLRFMLGSQRSHCHDQKKSGFFDGSEGVGQKRRMSSTTDRYRAGILDRHRDQQITASEAQSDLTKKGGKWEQVT